MQIRYVLEPRTLSFIVSAPALPRQRIAVLAPVMQRIAGVSPRATLGAASVTLDEAAALGFLPYGQLPIVAADYPEVNERDLVHA